MKNTNIGWDHILIKKDFVVGPNVIKKFIMGTIASGLSKGAMRQKQLLCFAPKIAMMKIENGSGKESLT